jgi:DUF1680 family protein
VYQFAKQSTTKTTIIINGKQVDYPIQNGYAILHRNWNKNDQVSVALPLEIKRIKSDTLITDNIGKIALQRGPIVYCAEWKDNNGKTSNIIVPANAAFTAVYNAGLLNGVTVLKTQTPVVQLNNNGIDINTKQQTFTAIPYYAWANRGKGEMTVWFPEKITAIDLLSK